MYVCVSIHIHIYIYTANLGKQLLCVTKQSDYKKLSLKKQENNLLVSGMCIDSLSCKMSENNNGLENGQFFKVNVRDLNCLQQTQSLGKEVCCL